jgi:pimeloyl-ACP methyl ester carboxylesterase
MVRTLFSPITLRGRGPTVVFVHGAGGSAGVGSAGTALAARFRVVTYSAGAHPPLPDAGDSYTYETHVADLVSLVRGLGADGVFLVGHSYGAYVALRVTSEHPELVRGVVLDEAPASWLLAGQPEYVEIERSRRAAVDSMRAALAANDSTAALRLLLDWTNAPGTFAKLTPEQKTEALANASALRHMLAAPPARRSAAKRWGSSFRQCSREGPNQSLLSTRDGGAEALHTASRARDLAGRRTRCQLAGLRGIQSSSHRLHG